MMTRTSGERVRGLAHPLALFAAAGALALAFAWPIVLPLAGVALVAGGLVARRGEPDARTRTLATAAIATGAAMLVLFVAIALLGISVRGGSDSGPG